MSETICNVMLFGGIALAIIFAIVAVVLFVKLDIPKVIGDLSGSTARKQIKEIREKGYESVQGSGASKQDAIKAKDSSGKIEVRDIKRKMSESGELSKRSNERYKKAVSELNKAGSGKLQEDADYDRETDILNDIDDFERETDILSVEDDYERETDILMAENDGEDSTDILSTGDEESTDILSMDDEESTDILSTYDEESTDILSAEDEESTDILSTYDEDSTDILSTNDEDSTDILTTMDEDATDVLKEEKGSEPAMAEKSNREAAGFKMLVDVVVVHTDESI